MCENWYSFVIIIPVVVASSSATFQSGHTNGNSNSSALLSLVGDTMCSTNGLPFDWASDYEVAVVYVTSMWSEIADARPESSSPEEHTVIAQLGFLSYCVRFKTELAAWSESLRDRSDVSDAVKKTVSNWYRAVDKLSHNNWTLPEVPSVESYEKLFRTSYKHLVINGAEVYWNAKSGRVKRDVNDFVKAIATMLIGILKGISRQFRDIPEKDDTENVLRYNI